MSTRCASTGTPRICRRRGSSLASAAVATMAASHCRYANALSPTKSRVGAASSPTSPSLLPLALTPGHRRLVDSSPCLGHASAPDKRTNYFVVGTSHFRCDSAAEVEQIIREIRPDGVVVELDPERVIRLTKEGAKHPEEEQLLGADFLSAIDTAKDMGVPLFIGDEYSKETRARFLQTALDPINYAPTRLFSALISSFLPMKNPGEMGSYINVPRVFIADPMKAAPLITTATPAFLLFLLTIQTYRIEDVGNDLATVFSLLFSFFATCKVFNNFISDRDEILAGNAIRAAEVISSLKSKETIRVRWTFTVNGNDAKAVGAGFGTEKSTEDQQSFTGYDYNSIPLFTLKTPLEQGRVRSLNLFEPRWLKMIDDVTSRQINGHVKQSFGCVTCTNKFYSTIQIDGNEGRYADVIFRRRGTMAKMVELVEGTRPVSGDRKVNVQIQGEEPFFVNESGLSISKDGYLVAACVQKMTDGDEDANGCEKTLNCDDNDEEDINIVVVVGLLHANGVIDRLVQT